MSPGRLCMSGGTPTPDDQFAEELGTAELPTREGMSPWRSRQPVVTWLSDTTDEPSYGLQFELKSWLRDRCLSSRHKRVPWLRMSQDIVEPHWRWGDGSRSVLGRRDRSRWGSAKRADSYSSD